MPPRDSGPITDYGPNRRLRRRQHRPGGSARGSRVLKRAAATRSSGCVSWGRYRAQRSTGGSRLSVNQRAQLGWFARRRNLTASARHWRGAGKTLPPNDSGARSARQNPPDLAPAKEVNPRGRIGRPSTAGRSNSRTSPAQPDRRDASGPTCSSWPAPSNPHNAAAP